MNSPGSILKTCTKCGVAKPADAAHFSRDARQSSGLRPDCKDCCREAHRAHYEANREQRIAQTKAYAEANSEAISQKNRERHARKMLERGDEVRAKRRAYHQRAGRAKFKAWFKKRMADDPQFRIRVNISAQFRQFVQNKPQGGFQAIVGYTVSELYAHLERQFDEGMSWENYGTAWEIDHIRPVSSFDLPDEAAQCWALSNLRPLACLENRKKSNKLIPELIGMI